jgi:arginase family enzyme
MQVPQYKFLKDNSLSVIGVAVNEGQDLSGTELGPKVLREAGLAKVIQSLNWEVKDLGDITNAKLEIEDTDASKYKYAEIKNAQVIGGLCKSLHNMCKNQLKMVASL